MKKFLLSLLTATVFATGSWAQTWNMVVTREDGTQEVIPTTKVKSVSFQLPDQNADQLIIKEIYCGGCPLDEGDGYFQKDKGFIIYNNSSKVVVANNLAVAIVSPFNSYAGSPWFKNGKLVYADQQYIPAIHGIWWFQSALIVQPYSQVVVSCQGSVDNTQTYSKSVNYANKDYYAMYDPESGYDGGGRGWYPSPSELIPTSHYLKAKRIGLGFAWPLSVGAPGLILFHTKDVKPAEFANNVDNVIYPPGAKQTEVNACFKIPTSWIIDGVEVYSNGYKSQNKKRLTPEIDGGSVLLTNQKGHTLYRNVDKTATEALPENAGKLVYTYTMGVTTGDPNNIDAEASIKKGAHIVYMDTNNSTDDFHERKEFSIRGK